MGNDLHQFVIFVHPHIDTFIVDRHDANDQLFQTYFNKHDFQTLVTDTIIKLLYEQLTGKTS